MHPYTFVIGSLDHFDSFDELKRFVLSGPDADDQRQHAVFEFGLANQTIVTAALVGRGLAFTHNWNCDNTVSGLLDEGSELYSE